MLQLQIETIAHCNARCSFCVYPTMERKRGTMGMLLYEKILQEAVSIPEITTLTLTGLGEPLLDKRLEDRIRFARIQENLRREKREPLRINLYTSGSHFTLPRARSLQEAGLDEIYVSLNAANAQARQELMKLNDYDQVVENIEAVRQYCPKLRVIVKGFSDSAMIDGDDRQEFVSKWDQGDGQRSVFLHGLGNWAGQLYPMRITPKKACSRALGQIMVLWDGRVSLCCFDGEGEVVFGNLNKSSLREVFNSELATRYRRLHAEGRRDELDLCKNCTMI